MPVEIRELVIRARVTPVEDAGTAGAPSPARDSVPAAEVAVESSVREVLRALEDKKER